MTVSLFSGTPGSGKSLHMCQEVEFWLKTKKRNVLANVQINRDYILRGNKGGRFFYIDNINLTPDFLYKYALKYHTLGVEHQSLLVIDEAQVLFSPTAVKLFTNEIIVDRKSNKAYKNTNYRMEWLEFFTQHRHLGFDVLLVTQFDKLIDAQFRPVLEYNSVHRKANNFKTLGNLLTIFRIQMFIEVQYWYGCKEKCGSRIFFYKKRYSKMYDSYAYRNVIVAKLRERYGNDFVESLLDPIGYKNKQEKIKQEKAKQFEQEVLQNIS